MQPTSALNFYPDGKCRVSNNPLYRLDESKLNADKVYLIFPEGCDAASYVVDYLRYITFSKTPQSYRLGVEVKEDIIFFSLSMPKEYKETYQKIAELYKLKCLEISQGVLLGNVTFVIPKSDKIVVVRGSYDQAAYLKEKERLKILGSMLDKLELD